MKLPVPSLSNLVIPPWVRIAWKLAPWLALLIAASALQITRSTLAETKSQYALQSAKSELASKTQALEWSTRLSDARGSYLQTLQNLSTLKDKSDEDTRTFATTPAGAAPCLSLDRVRSALSYRSDLASAAAAEGGSGEVSSGSDPSPRPDSK